MTSEAPIPPPAPPQTVYDLELRDKPAGYGLGEYRGRLAVVELCSKCGKGGFRVLSRVVIHSVKLKKGAAGLFFDRDTFDTFDACKLSRGPKVAARQTEMELDDGT